MDTKEIKVFINDRDFVVGEAVLDEQAGTDEYLLMVSFNKNDLSDHLMTLYKEGAQIGISFMLIPEDRQS